MLGMHQPYPLGLARVVQPAQAVRGHRLQQPVPHAGRAVHDHHERPVDEPGQRVEHVDPGLGAHRLGRVQRAPVGVRGQTAQHHPLGLGEQRPAPVDHRGQRLLARGSAALEPGQQPEPVVQPVHQLVDPERPDPGRGHLQGQRDAVQPAAELRDRLGVPGVEGEPPGGRGRPRHEQPDRVGPRHRGRVRPVREFQRRHTPEGLAGDVQRLAAGRQDPQPGRGPQQHLGQLGGLVDHVLAVVEHQQQPPVAQRVHEPLPGRGAVRADVERDENGLGQGRRPPVVGG